MDALARACENVARFNSRLKKVAILAGYLAPLGDADLKRAVSFLCCGPAVGDGTKKFSVGGATLRDATLRATGWDPATLSACYTAVGDTGETIGHLLRGHTFGEPLTLARAEEYYAQLYSARRIEEKVQLLHDIFVHHRPGTLKFFVKVISRDLRIGLQSRQVEEAIAIAAGVPHEEIRRASNKSGDLPNIALAARRGELHLVEARLFHPMDFMMAKPLDNVADLPDPENWWIEDKFDGIRSQVHLSDREVRIFTRGMEDATAGFPELVQELSELPGSAVMDGEILAWREGRALAFTVLQQRIARRKLAAEIIESVPLVFVAYDLLLEGGQMLVDLPIEERRARLESILAGRGQRLKLSERMTAGSTGEIDRLFLNARERGNEGLLLKRKGSIYESGKRSDAWYKIKRPYATLDVVVTAAEVGHGKRATMLSDYTFGVKSGEGFVNVGKAYSGLTDAEIRELTRLFKSLAIDRFGRVTLVRPEVVLEVAFDGVQKSSRHKSGYALRFPRILHWRKDKRPEDCDTLERVAALYEASLR